MNQKENTLSNHFGDLQAERPVHLDIETETFDYNRELDINMAIQALLDGEKVLITDFFSTGLNIVKELSKLVKKRFPKNTFEGQREYRLAFHDISQNLLLKITDHKLSVKKAPEIGWIEVLYPELESFLLPFTKVQGLNSAWQWYKKGVSVPVLRNKVHPYVGTYFPSRFEHLQLFDNWLSRYEGPKKTAYDIGIGSGILSLMMMKHKFQMVYGTDTNPNTIVGLHLAHEGTKLSRKIELDYGSLFGTFTKPSELIVFNPPWLPATREMDRIDEAVYYPNNLFPDFFEVAGNHLLPDGRIVLLFSNIGLVSGLSKTNPIEEELSKNDRFEKELLLTKKVGQASNKTKRNQTWRDEEQVELWVLTLKQ